MVFFYDPYNMLGLIVIYIVLIIVFYVIAILLAIWVYKDAKKRGMNAAVWLLIVLIFGCCGCILYLILREKK